MYENGIANESARRMRATLSREVHTVNNNKNEYSKNNKSNNNYNNSGREKTSSFI